MVHQVALEPARVHPVKLELAQQRPVRNTVETARAIQQAEQGDLALIHGTEHMVGECKQCGVGRMVHHEPVLARREQVVRSEVRIQLFKNNSLGDFGYGSEN